VIIGVAGTLLGFIILLLPPYPNFPILSLILILASFGLLTYFSHCLAHFIVGEAIGLKFSHYVFGASPLAQSNHRTIRTLDRLIPRLGIRLTRESRNNATHRQRGLVFSAGALTSVLLPLTPVIWGYLTLPRPLELIPAILWLAYSIFEAYSSPRFGDLSRIKVSP
jgi:hypothetical protein